MQKYISVVLPLHNEEQNILPLYQELSGVLKKFKKDYEILFVDDGSSDSSLSIVSQLQKKDKNVQLVSFKKKSGKAAALTAGFKNSNGKFILQMDCDLQDDPKYVPEFLKMLENGADLVVGCRIKREDGLIRIFESTVFNFFVNIISDIKLHDSNCGFKGYKSDVAKKLKLKGGMHRFIPFLISKSGGKIKEIMVVHRARKFGESKYGLRRIFEAAYDYLRLLVNGN